MKSLADLLKPIEVIEIHGAIDTKVTGLRYDSRRVEAGDCFVAIPGFKSDGATFISEAVIRGASAVITEAPLGTAGKYSQGVPCIRVTNARRALGRLAAEFYDHPWRGMDVIGVTGTNGKTTVVAMLHKVLSSVEVSAKIGTLGMELSGPGSGEGFTYPTTLTTPEAPDIFRFISQAREAACRSLVMEVSSVALKLHRVDDLPFAQAVFTTFSGDHLDFHRTMDAYFSAKLKLFERLPDDGWAILNLDDPRSYQILDSINCGHLTYGFSTQADVRPVKHHFSLAGTRAQIRTPRGDLEIESRLIGRVNLLNIMAAVASLTVRDVPLTAIARSIGEFTPIRGRLDVSYSNDFAVLIDYAHTDNALETLLHSLKEIVKGRVILVFGAGGSRDRSKRPRMGSVASRLADFVIVTSDNPREEQPEKIVENIVDGFVPDFRSYEIVINREEAIARSLELAAKGDMVVIAGKGHEDYQIFKDRVIHFDDYEMVRHYLKKPSGGRKPDKGDGSHA